MVRARQRSAGPYLELIAQLDLKDWILSSHRLMSIDYLWRECPYVNRHLHIHFRSMMIANRFSNLPPLLAVPTSGSEERAEEFPPWSFISFLSVLPACVDS